MGIGRGIGRRDLLRAGAVLGAAALTGCTTTLDGTPRPARSRPRRAPATVRLGVAEYRPYAFPGDAGVTGEVVEVARAVCERLGSTLTVELLPYETFMSRIDAGVLDVVGGVSIRVQNCASLDFSVPDHVSLTAIVVPAGNPKGIDAYREVVATGARLGVVANALEAGTAAEAGVTGPRVYPTTEEMLRGVTAGEVDCGAHDDITLRDRLASTPGLELRPPFEPVGGSPRYGFGFREGDGLALRDAFDEELTRLHDSGEWLRITRPFGFTEANIPTTNHVPDKACDR